MFMTSSLSTTPAPEGTGTGDLRGYSNVVVITGAGISAASGIATYRDAESGWVDPDMEAMSHASQYRTHLARLWPFWSRLRAATAAAAPNSAHLALTAAQTRVVARGGELTVLTQNIDGLHTRAGTTAVLELHGSIHRSRCVRRSCGPAFADERVLAPGQQVLGCLRCERPARPDIVLFGEDLPGKVVHTAVDRLERADLCLYVGTSGTVSPANSMVTIAREAGARCVLVNAQPWLMPNPAFHDTILGPAEVLLPTLLG